ncbi:metal ABC transporter substrate-binding protein [Planctomonas deserti]|uniref:metal ABC transporter substrate-binding protein n=1 Tax=Planctomonas deserti TaxID=2144185 RepID=UPI00197BD7E5|nr:metal ABC transporter substrate-binding protein [Planctomonas deserti]
MPKSGLAVHRNSFRAGAIGLATALTLAGCAAPAAEADRADERPLVLTTFTVLADIARQVGGDEVRVESLLKTGAEIHGYEPTPSDLVRASGADLILDNGLGLEGWFQQFLTTVDVPHAVLSDGVDTLPIATGHYAGEPNPHAWMSPVVGQQYVGNVADALSGLLPERADVFQANAAAYREELQGVADRLEAAVSTLPVDARVLVTCEGAFSYLARDAGLDEGFLWAVNSDNEGTPQQIAATTRLVADRDVPTVFCESTVNDAVQRQVARTTGAAFAGPLYVDSLSRPDGPVPSYLDLLEHDVDVITKGLAHD